MTYDFTYLTIDGMKKVERITADNVMAAAEMFRSIPHVGDRPVFHIGPVWDKNKEKGVTDGSSGRKGKNIKGA